MANEEREKQIEDAGIEHTAANKPRCIAGDNLSSVWHKGSEKPSIYRDELTGNTLRTYALCIIWYDGWIEDLCRVTEDHIFISMTSGKTYLPTDFEYWAYTHDLIPKDLEL